MSPPPLTAHAHTCSCVAPLPFPAYAVLPSTFKPVSPADANPLNKPVSPTHDTLFDKPLTLAQWSAFFKANWSAFAVFGGTISAVALAVSYQSGLQADMKILENNAKKDKEMLENNAKKDKEILENSIKAMNESAELAALKNTLLFGQSDKYKTMREHTSSTTSPQKTSEKP